MSSKCDRHPTQPAWWHCQRCYKNLCPQCISRRTGGHLDSQTFYFCPKCNVEVTGLDLSQVIPPFWKQLHKFFVYPFSSIQSIGLILVISLLTTLFHRQGLILWLGALALSVVMAKYSFEALRFTAQGRFSPPPLSSQVMYEDYFIVIKQVVLLVIAVVVPLLVMHKVHPLAAILIALVEIVAWPAMLIILIINDSLLQALNPVLFIGMIIRIGGSYFLFLFFWLLLFFAPWALGGAVIQYLPENIQLFTFNAAKIYYVLITYHMMGYLILQYHNRVGYPVELEAILASMFPLLASGSEKSEDAEEVTWQKELLNEVSLLSQEGDLDGAIAKIEQSVEVSEIEDLELSERYISLLKMQKRDAALLNYASHHLYLLIKAGSKTKATTLYMECLRIDKAFKPPALALFKISGWLNESNKSKAAIFALNTLIKHHPKDKLVPKAYYRAAQIFDEQLKNVEQAKKILNSLLAKFPDHEIAGFAKNYLGRL